MWAVVTAERGLNVRAGPNLNAPIVGTLQLGTCVRLVASLDGWRQIDSATWDGYTAVAWLQAVTRCPV